MPHLVSPLKEPDVRDASRTAKPSSSVIDLEATFIPVGQMRQISRVTELEGAAISGELDLSAEL